jgi:hypothetical protein
VVISVLANVKQHDLAGYRLRKREE